MNRKFILMTLVVGLLAAAVLGGAVLASGGEPGEGSEGDAEEMVVKDGDFSVESIENHDLDLEEPDELSVRVAELLGTDPQATHDAMVQADASVEASPGNSLEDGQEDEQDIDSMSVEAEGMSYLEYGTKIGAILEVDGQRIANAIAQAYEGLYGVERDIREKGSGRDAEGKEGTGKLPAGPAGRLLPPSL